MKSPINQEVDTSETRETPQVETSKEHALGACAVEVTDIEGLEARIEDLDLELETELGWSWKGRDGMS